MVHRLVHIRHHPNRQDRRQILGRPVFLGGRLSLRQIREKLRQRGFPGEAIEACCPEDSREREEAVALACLRAKFRTPAPAEKWKVFLYRRGFDMAVCEAAAASFRAEAPPVAEEDDGFDE